MREKLKVLVVEDSAASRELLALYLEPIADVEFSKNLTDGERCFAEHPDLDVVVLDLGLPESTGLATLDRFRRSCPEATVVVLTAMSEAEFGEAALEAGAQDYLVKEQINARGAQRSIRYAAQRAEVVRNNQRLEAHLLESRRLEALGQISASLAHELATPLQCIASCARTIGRVVDKLDPGPGPEHGRSMARLEEAASTLRECVSHCLVILESTRRLGRAPQEHEAHANVTECVDLVLSATRPLWGRHARIARRFDDDAHLAKIGPTELQQILFNLIRNAAQAVEQLPPDRASIELRVLRQGPRVRVQVADNGTGMAESTRRRAFEPFFTTRDVKNGTGLGLASVYALARAANGDAYIESEEGHGTTVTVTLPLSQVG